MNPVEKTNIDQLIVEKAKQIQESNGYSDAEMAKLIGYTRRETYNLIKNGKKPVGADFYRGILAWLDNNGRGLITLKDKRNSNGKRYWSTPRQTKETDINLEIEIDGSGKAEINNGMGMFDHLLSQLAQHGRFDLKVSASAIDGNQHHLIEDVAICLGQAFNNALGDKRGITRMGDATVTMDDARAMVAVDISGRAYTDLDLRFSRNSKQWQLLGFPPELISHFLTTFANEARINLHAKVTNGADDHHKAEALFKALGRALDIATRIDNKLAGGLPTTKGMLEE
jgi:imidazoleglycerol-phosphate dehydratase